jgi:hypothetical protein
MATVPLSPALRMASSKPRWVMCFMNVREVEFWKITEQKTDKMDYGKIQGSKFRRKWSQTWKDAVTMSAKAWMTTAASMNQLFRLVILAASI